MTRLLALTYHTGTLTKNEQTVTEVYAVDETVIVEGHEHVSPAVIKTLEVGALCNNCLRDETGAFVGQATDVALLNVLKEFDLPDPRQVFNRLHERPFDSEAKYMAVSGILPTGATLDRAEREMVYVKGAIEGVLARCRAYHVTDDSTPPLDASTRSLILEKANAAAARGLRVLASAYGLGSAAKADDGGARDLVFAGFSAMRDPPRRGVADAVGALAAGGVQVVMITGDAEATALAIARDLGLRGARALTGAQLDRMTKAQLREAVGGVSVFARTTPRHKMAIVEAFQSRGAVVAMTGDGGALRDPFFCSGGRGRLIG